MRLDWGSVRTLDGVGLDPGLVEAVVSARDIEQGHRDLMILEDVVYYNRCLSEAALLVTSELVEAVCTGRSGALGPPCLPNPSGLPGAPGAPGLRDPSIARTHLRAPVPAP